ncbi:MAG: flavodoxin family protein [Rhodococcus sp. (in: high G+C Gram-positive bacteria)]|jgi:flavodoxin|uniref:flavodoxin family protein n=1 Tax=Rhodococcus sp. EPR-157 TaxID=1813677 RepID=UPI0007BAFF48|nr:flavodoxin family protein [Rhodococcus sp. EPR-157]KZF00932.1 flavodoxin [Rhodococcus sp. EPR-157]
MAKSIIVCTSISHGNTKKIADAIGDVLDAPVVAPAAADLAGYDMVGFGSGIYFGSFHSDLRAFVESLPQQDGRTAFLFATSGLPETRLTRFSGRLVELLEDKGFDVVGGFSCRGFDTFLPFKLVGGIRKGQPDEDDVASARAFAEHLRDAVGNDRG